MHNEPLKDGNLPDLLASTYLEVRTIYMSTVSAICLIAHTCSFSRAPAWPGARAPREEEKEGTLDTTSSQPLYFSFPPATPTLS